MNADFLGAVGDNTQRKISVGSWDPEESGVATRRLIFELLIVIVSRTLPAGARLIKYSGACVCLCVLLSVCLSVCLCVQSFPVSKISPKVMNGI